MTNSTKFSIKWFAERAAAASVIFGFLGILTGGVWFFAKNEVLDALRNASGLEEFAIVINASVDANRQAIESLTEVVEQVLKNQASPKLVEYDELRSRVFDPCYVGKMCEAGILARRTREGDMCGAPTVLRRTVFDKAGVPREAVKADTKPPVKINEGFEWRYVRFIVPSQTPQGVAEYQIQLEYQCPWGTVTESTPRIPFEVINQNGER